MKLLLILIVILSLFSCQRKQSDSSLNELNIPISSNLDSIDPAISYDVVSGNILYQTYETLYQYHYLKRPLTLEPLLAKEMPQFSNDLKKVTIRIKENIRYHDHPSFKGKPRYVTAHDFITQIKRIAFISTRSTGTWLFEGKIEGFDEFRKNVGSDFQKFLNSEISGLKAINDHTLEIKLTQPFPQLNYILAMNFTAPIPMEAVIHHKNILNDHIIGTGPYKLDQWVHSSKVVLTKNEHYHQQLYPSEGDRVANTNQFLKDAGKKLPFVDKVNFRIIKEDQTRWLNFLAEKVDYIGVPKDNFSNTLTTNGELTPELKQKGVKIQITPTKTYWWLSFNMQDPLLGKNKNLRLAIAHAIDVKKLIKVFTNNTSLKANSIIPPGVFGYDPKRKQPFDYNPAKAKELLTLAGFPNGKNLPEIKFDVRGAQTTQRQLAEFIRAELAKIGINIKVVLNTFPGFLQKSRQGELQFWMDGWAMDYPDAENSLQLLHSNNHPPGPNGTYFNNQEFDQLFNQIQKLPDGNKKFELIQKAENIVANEFPWMMLYYSRSYLLNNKRIQNFRYSDSIPNFIKYLRIGK